MTASQTNIGKQQHRIVYDNIVIIVIVPRGIMKLKGTYNNQNGLLLLRWWDNVGSFMVVYNEPNMPKQIIFYMASVL